VIPMAWSAAVGAPFGQIMVLSGTSGLVSVTNEDGWSGLSSNLADVRRTPRFVARSTLMREVGILAEGEGENQSYLTGVWWETPRFVAWWFECLLDDERSKINKSDLSGGCARVRAPTFVAWSSRLRSVC